MKSVGNGSPERRNDKGTALRAVSPPSLYLSKVILHTSSDASEEVPKISRAAAEIKTGKRKKGHQQETTDEDAGGGCNNRSGNAHAMRRMGRHMDG